MERTNKYKGRDGSQLVVLNICQCFQVYDNGVLHDSGSLQQCFGRSKVSFGQDPVGLEVRLPIVILFCRVKGTKLGTESGMSLLSAHNTESCCLYTATALSVYEV
jgi:hypothetical protein